MARQARIEEAHMARQARIQEAHMARQARIEEGHMARQARIAEGHMARQTRIAEGHMARQARLQQAHMAREARLQQAHMAREASLQKRYTKRNPRTSFHSVELNSDTEESECLTSSSITNSNKPTNNFVPHYLSPSSINDDCSYLSLAHEFISSLNWSKAFFNKKFDRCYCNYCYKAHWDNVVQAGGASYVIPRGWVRLGVQVDSVTAQIHNIWNCWHVTYHGTSKQAAVSILQHRQFSIPGDQLLDGSFLAIRPGHIPGKRFIYTSPTIAYSSLSVYCPSYDFMSDDGNHYKVKIVLECRQNPELMHIQRETVGYGNRRICPHISNEKIEYFTEARASLVAYGLLVHFEEMDE